MRTVFAQTLLTILRSGNILVYLLFVEGVTVLSGYASKYLLTNAIMQIEFTGSADLFLLFCFFWILGPPFLMFIVFHGIGLIAAEKKEGTLLLLASKPLARYKIFMGKWLALTVSSLILGLCSTFIAILLMTVFVHPDNSVIYELIKITPLLGIYLLFIVVCFSTVSAGLSVLCNSRKKILVVFLIFFIIIYLIIPIIKTSINWQCVSFGYWQYLDLSSHFQGMYAYFLSASQDVIFSRTFADSIIAVKPLPVILFWLISCISFIFFALRKFQNMDIV